MMRLGALLTFALTTQVFAQNTTLISEMCWITYQEGRQKVQKRIKNYHEEKVEDLKNMQADYPYLESIVKTASSTLTPQQNAGLKAFQMFKEKYGKVLQKLTVLLRPYDITSSDVTERQFLYAFLLFDEKEIKRIAETLPSSSPKKRLLKFAEENKEVLKEVREAVDIMFKVDLARARDHLIDGEEHIQCKNPKDPMIRFKCAEPVKIRTAKFSFHGDSLPVLEACSILDPREEVPIRLCAAKDFITGKIVKRVEGVDTEEQHEERIHRAAMKDIAETCEDDIELRRRPKQSSSVTDGDRWMVPEKPEPKKEPENIFLRGVLRQ